MAHLAAQLTDSTPLGSHEGEEQGGFKAHVHIATSKLNITNNCGRTKQTDILGLQGVRLDVLLEIGGFPDSKISEIGILSYSIGICNYSLWDRL